ncbi:MAG: hypothetical protein ABIF08_01375 [Nanoarchaeota archaeon]
MRWIIFVFLLLMLMLPLVQADHSVQIKLSLNNIENTVYIPGNDTSNSSDWGSENIFSSPTHKYIASYNNTNILSALVFSNNQFNSLLVDGNGNIHTIGINVSFTNSKVLLAFTKGDWKTIEDDISKIETSSFFTFFEPSFSYGMGLYLPLKILLEYSTFNITGVSIFQLGTQTLIATNNGVIGNKTVIDVRKI